jgi:hypothetical protein
MPTVRDRNGRLTELLDCAAEIQPFRFASTVSSPASVRRSPDFWHAFTLIACLRSPLSSGFDASGRVSLPGMSPPSATAPPRKHTQGQCSAHGRFIRTGEGHVFGGPTCLFTNEPCAHTRKRALGRKSARTLARVRTDRRASPCGRPTGCVRLEGGEWTVHRPFVRGRVRTPDHSPPARTSRPCGETAPDAPQWGAIRISPP